MRPFAPSIRHTVIIEGLSKGQSVRKIAASLNLNPSTVLRDIGQMEKRGYVARQVRSNQVLYSILPLGQELMQHPVKTSLTGGSINATPPEKLEYKIRLHRLQIKFDLVNPIQNPAVIKFHDHPSKIVPLEHWQKNIIQFEDFTAILSTRSLIIAGVQRYLKAAENVEAQESDVLSEIIPFAEQVEEKIRKIHPSFRLKRLDRGVLSGKIISREIAFEDHHLAKVTGPMRIDAPDGKPRIIVDKSNGPLELEFVHRDTAPQDSEQMRKNDLILATNDLGDALDALKTQVSIVTELTRHAATTQDQMDQVISGLGQITNILGAMWRS